MEFVTTSAKQTSRKSQKDACFFRLNLISFGALSILYPRRGLHPHAHPHCHC